MDVRVCTARALRAFGTLRHRKIILAPWQSKLQKSGLKMIPEQYNEWHHRAMLSPLKKWEIDLLRLWESITTVIVKRNPHLFLDISQEMLNGRINQSKNRTEDWQCDWFLILNYIIAAALVHLFRDISKSLLNSIISVIHSTEQHEDNKNIFLLSIRTVAQGSHQSVNNVQK